MARPVVRLVARMTRGVLEPGSGGHLVGLWWTGHRHRPGEQLGRGTRNQLLSILAYTGPAPKHAPKPASVIGNLVLVGQATLYNRNMVFHLNSRPPNCRLVHQPVLSTAHHTTAQGRFCRPGYLLAGNATDMNTDYNRSPNRSPLLSSDLYPHDSLLVPCWPV